MATTFASLGLDHLSAQEKWAVAQDLLGEGTGEAMPGGFASVEEFHAELDRREAEADADPSQLLEWDEVYAATKKRFAEKRAVKG